MGLQALEAERLVNVKKHAAVLANAVTLLSTVNKQQAEHTLGFEGCCIVVVSSKHSKKTMSMQSEPGGSRTRRHSTYCNCVMQNQPTPNARCVWPEVAQANAGSLHACVLCDARPVLTCPDVHHNMARRGVVMKGRPPNKGGHISQVRSSGPPSRKKMVMADHGICFISTQTSTHLQFAAVDIAGHQRSSKKTTTIHALH
jgi:hypothetical protein